MLEGMIGAPGVARGFAWRCEAENLTAPEGRRPGAPSEEKARVQTALAASRQDLLDFSGRKAREMGDDAAAIFEAHLAMLEDDALSAAIESLIDMEGQTAEVALDTTVEQFAAMFENLEDAYLRERAADVRDVGRRVMRHLLGKASASLGELPADAVLVAADLAPSDTVNLDASNVRALVIERGGATSHTAILARTLGIPALMGVSGLMGQVQNGDELIVDALGEQRGRLYIRPDRQEREELQARLSGFRADQDRLANLRDLPAETQDGERVVLAANIGGPKDVEAVLRHGGQGVGLFRTEFLFMNAAQPPTEEQQFQAYSKVVQALQPELVVIRTLDVGGDKEIPFLGIAEEANPFLGWRGLRYCLDTPGIFRPQLRAVLRAAAGGRVAVMFPMVSTLEELQRAKGLVAQLKAELVAEGQQAGDVQVGIMVEVPAAAVTADILAREADFFSIGTNDLTQYTLAVDRTNQRVGHLYDSLHPAVLRLVAQVIRVGKENGRWVGLCGELAGDPLAAPVLLGLGLQEFSMSPTALPKIKEVIRSLSLPDAQRLAEEALAQPDAASVRRLVRERLARRD